MAEIHEIGEIRQRQIRVTKLREMLGDRFDCVLIPPPGIVLKDVVYIFPSSCMRRIDDLTLSEMDDLLNGKLEFFIMR